MGKKWKHYFLREPKGIQQFKLTLSMKKLDMFYGQSRDRQKLHEKKWKTIQTKNNMPQLKRKLAYLYTDSEETDTSSSVENVKKKKKLSILKFTSGNLKKKKCKLHSKSEPEDSDRSRKSSQKIIKQKLRGILKHTERESSEEDEESEPSRIFRSQDRCLVGRVPRPAGAKPGRGGGVAIIVRKNVSNLQAQQSSSGGGKRHQSSAKRINRKRSY